MTDIPAFRYRAFISYSHRDTGWAKWLHARIEGFRIDKDLAGRETPIGPVPKALRPVFRDRHDFQAGHSLTDQTLAALEASAALIVLCSPAAAKSHYVNEEIRLFKANHPGRPVVPLILDGKPGDPERECFPPALRFELDADGAISDRPAEVVAADIRETGDGRQLALAKVVAGILALPPDEIFRRAERERRRQNRVRNGIIGALAMLAIVATGSAVFAWQQLKTNEAFLDATLDRFTSLVDRAVGAAQTYSLPLSVTLGFLSEAEGMLDVMAQYGRPTPKLLYRRAVMLRAFADNYRDLGRTDEWERRIREAQAIMTRLVAENPGNAEWATEQIIAHGSAGDLALAKGNLDEAVSEYEKATSIIRRLSDADPENVGHLRNLSVSHNKIGDVLVAQGDLTRALAAYKADLAIAERLATADRGNAGWQRDLSVSQEKIGDVLRAQGDLTGALAAFQQSLAIRERLAQADPGNAEWQRNLSVSHNKIGDVLVAQGNLTGALAAYRQSLDIAERLAQADPGNAGWQRDLSVSHNKIGDVLAAQGDLTGALAVYQQGLAIRERLSLADPGNAEWQRDVVVSNWKLAHFGTTEERRARWRAVIAKLEEMKARGILLPTDEPYIAAAKQNLAALGAKR